MSLIKILQYKDFLYIFKNYNKYVSFCEIYIIQNIYIHLKLACNFVAFEIKSSQSGAPFYKKKKDMIHFIGKFEIPLMKH